MKGAKKAKRLWLIILLLTLITSLISVPLCAISALKLKYVLTGITATVILHGCYGIGFYFLAYARAKAAHKCIIAIENGANSVLAISEHTGYTEKTVRQSIIKAQKKGYLTGHEVDLQ
jgi:hypothetical protein